MRLLLRCLIASAVLSLVVFGWLFVSTTAKIGWLIVPALWLADKLVGSFVAIHDSGLENLVSLLPFVFLLNTLLYTITFFLSSKSRAWRNQKKTQTFPLKITLRLNRDSVIATARSRPCSRQSVLAPGQSLPATPART